MFFKKPASLGPGPTRIAEGRIPADQSMRRIPMLVWGDVFPNGDRPQLRRALAGADAHDCMYTWVYLNELLAVHELNEAARQRIYSPPASPRELYERFEELRKASQDPQCQISDELTGVFLSAAVFLAAAGSPNAEFCELGSTFFASIEKLDLCGAILGTPVDRNTLLFSGIEYSAAMQRASRYFHQTDHIRLLKTPAEWQREREFVFHVSRFVGSYAFRSTADFVKEVSRCDAFHFIDVFNIEPSDFHSWDLGLPITFLDLAAGIDQFTDLAFDLYLTKATPEFHAAGRQKAAVIQLFGIKTDVAKRIDYFPRFSSLGGFESSCKARPIGKGDGAQVLREVDASLSSTEWEAFAEYKKYFPVWGGPQGLTKQQVAQLASTEGLGMDLSFDTGQSAAILKDVINSGSWDPR